MKKIFSFLSLSLLLPGCIIGSISGNGIPATRTLSGTAVEKLSCGNVWQVEIETGADENLLTISCDENLMEYVDLHYANSTSIHVTRSVSPKLPMLLRIKTTKNLQELDISGACQAQVTGPRQENMDVETSGASIVKITLPVGTMDLDSSGASKITLTDVDKLLLECSGSSQMSANAIGNAELRCSGAAQVRLSKLDSGNIRGSGASILDIGELTGSLNGALSGAALVSYGGSGTASCSTSGASHVSHR